MREDTLALAKKSRLVSAYTLAGCVVETLQVGCHHLTESAAQAFCSSSVAMPSVQL